MKKLNYLLLNRKLQVKGCGVTRLGKQLAQSLASESSKQNRISI